MRVLWVDADGNPFTDPSGWRVLEDFGLQVKRVTSIAEAQKEIPKKNFELLLIRAELQGTPSLLVQARKLIGKSGRKLVLASSEWSKEQFKAHSKTDGAAHRYARIPMPPEGLLNLVADLFGCTVEELADFDLPEQGEGIPAPAAPAPAPKKLRKAAPLPTGDSGSDLEVLRKYLSIREEQLELAEGERTELSRENERLQKEAHQLQLRLREFEHTQDELAKKLEQMEEAKSEADRKAMSAQEEGERANRIQNERIKGLEAQVGDADDKYESLRGRVRKDIRKIRENERDLEARLELARKDSETLMQARDQKVIELQRKIDALEFDLDQVQDSRVQAQMEAERYLAKLSRVSRALQIANSMIDDDRAGEAELEELEPVAGGAANAEEPVAEAAHAAPAAAEAPPAEEAAPADESNLSPELSALANEGEPTQMIQPGEVPKAEGEPGSSS
ncbi:MAG TPA: hypothetical protein VIH99_14365 [Bdellovibrionota bacterium]|jgi:hypothetical protein